MNAIKHTASFEIAQPIDVLFPLFSAEGEKLWVPDWDYDNIMGTTELSENYVFLTRTHDHAATEAIWLVKRYEPEQHSVEFYKVEPGDKVGVVTVDCSAKGPSLTHVTVSYEYIALSESGRVFIGTFDREAYAAFIDEWRKLLNRYFAAPT